MIFFAEGECIDIWQYGDDIEELLKTFKEIVNSTNMHKLDDANLLYLDIQGVIELINQDDKGYKDADNYVFRIQFHQSKYDELDNSWTFFMIEGNYKDRLLVKCNQNYKEYYISKGSLKKITNEMYIRLLEGYDEFVNLR